MKEERSESRKRTKNEGWEDEANGRERSECLTLQPRRLEWAPSRDHLVQRDALNAVVMLMLKMVIELLMVDECGVTISCSAMLCGGLIY